MEPAIADLMRRLRLANAERRLEALQANAEQWLEAYQQAVARLSTKQIRRPG